MAIHKIFIGGNADDAGAPPPGPACAANVGCGWTSARRLRTGTGCCGPTASRPSAEISSPSGTGQPGAPDHRLVADTNDANFRGMIRGTPTKASAARRCRGAQVSIDVASHPRPSNRRPMRAVLFGAVRLVLAVAAFIGLAFHCRSIDRLEVDQATVDLPGRSAAADGAGETSRRLTVTFSSPDEAGALRRSERADPQRQAFRLRGRRRGAAHVHLATVRDVRDVPCPGARHRGRERRQAVPVPCHLRRLAADPAG